MQETRRAERPRLRRMREADVRAVARIDRQGRVDPWPRRRFRECLREGLCCWVADQQGLVCAYGVMSVGGQVAHITNLAVRRGHQRCGLGRRMLEHLLGEAGRQDAETVMLEVRASNRAARGLYRSMGFIPAGIREAYYLTGRGWENAVIMVRPLAGRRFPESQGTL